MDGRTYSNSQINHAGEILADPDKYKPEQQLWATFAMAYWRGLHAYPINTFQALLRKKLQDIDESAIVAQRLKRASSIVLKLQRFEGMQLARMQDIGGLRAVVSRVKQLRTLEQAYRNASFKHRLTHSKDYTNEPKADGYRGIHLIYRYYNDRAPAEYAGLYLELQLRTRLQHAWATAVETMGTFLGQALKSGQGEEAWRSFFAKSGAALAVIERTAPVPGFEGKTRQQIFEEVAEAESRLHVLEKLRGFAIAADKITTERGRGAYHLVVLDSVTRSVTIRPYPMAGLEQANKDYAEIELRTKAGESIDAVLVSAGPVDALRKAYPNYFLDTQAFMAQIHKVITESAVNSKRKAKPSRRAATAA